MLSVFLDKETVDLGDIDFSALDNSLKELRHYPATRPEQVVEQIVVQQLAENIQAFVSGHPVRVVV